MRLDLGVLRTKWSEEKDKRVDLEARLESAEREVGEWRKSCVRYKGKVCILFYRSLYFVVESRFV